MPNPKTRYLECVLWHTRYVEGFRLARFYWMRYSTPPRSGSASFKDVTTTSGSQCIHIQHTNSVTIQPGVKQSHSNIACFADTPMPSIQRAVSKSIRRARSGYSITLDFFRSRGPHLHETAHAVARSYAHAVSTSSLITR